MSVKMSASIDSKALKAGKKPDGVLPFVLTTKTVDRDSEVVLPGGADVTNFVKNPVFVWAHDIRNRPPIGKLLPDTFEITEEYFKSDVQFDLKDPFAKSIYQKYKDGFLNTGSIRFSPKTVTAPFMDGQKGATIATWELLEFSAVPVPANPQALVQKSKSISDNIQDLSIEKQLIEEIEKYSDPEKYRERLKEIEIALNAEPSTTVKILDYFSDAEQAEKNENGHKSFAIVNTYNKDVAEDATILECPDMTEVPHPFAGKSVRMKEIVFVPPIETADNKTYFISVWDDPEITDSQLIEKYVEVENMDLSDGVASLTKDQKSVFKNDIGFDDFMIQGAFSEKTIKAVEKFIKNSEFKNVNPENKTFAEVVDETKKLLYGDSEYIEAFRKKKYSEFAEIYKTNGKKIPEFIKLPKHLMPDSRQEEPKNKNKSEQEKKLIFALAVKLAKEIMTKEKEG